MSRFAMMLIPAAIMTFSLQMVMVSMIQFANRELDKDTTVRLPDIFMPETEMQTLRSVEKPEKPQLDDTPPPEVPMQAFDQVDGNAEVGALAAPTQITAALDLNIGGGISASDGEYLPLVKVAPRYPRGALSRGLEGDVLLEFTVTKQGTVSDAVVVESSSAIFDQAAIDSALRYKYKPRVENGEAIEVPKVRTVIRFRLEKS